MPYNVNIKQAQQLMHYVANSTLVVSFRNIADMQQKTVALHFTCTCN